MATESTQLISPLTSFANGTDTELSITPIISAYVSRIIGYINTYVLGILLGVVGIFTNTANISVYWKMGLSKTTNISFFALSIFDLLVSMSTVMVMVTRNQPVSLMRLPSGALVSELGMALCFILYPCLSCSAWTTAILTIERCLCISAPLKVKGFITPGRIKILILSMVAYQSVLVILLFVHPGPPYDFYNQRRALYLSCSYSFPSVICFFVVLASTTLLVVRLMQNLEWRNKAAKQCNNNPENPKEMKAALCVVAICTIFIICFAPNAALFVASFVYTKFSLFDLYLGNLAKIIYGLSSLLQVLSSAVNIAVYYRMGTKYREVFKALFCGKRVK